MIYLDISIAVIMIILWIILKDFIKFLKITFILNFITGYIIIILGIIVKIFIKNKIKYINIVNIIFNMITKRGLIILLIGVIELIIYIIIIIYKKYCYSF